MHLSAVKLGVLDDKADLKARPVSPEEATFISFLVAHFLTAYRATCLDETVSLGKLAEDAGSFFSLRGVATSFAGFNSTTPSRTKN